MDCRMDCTDDRHCKEMQHTDGEEKVPVAAVFRLVLRIANGVEDKRESRLCEAYAAELGISDALYAQVLESVRMLHRTAKGGGTAH